MRALPLRTNRGNRSPTNTSRDIFRDRNNWSISKRHYNIMVLVPSISVGVTYGELLDFDDKGRILDDPTRLLLALDTISMAPLCEISSITSTMMLNVV